MKPLTLLTALCAAGAIALSASGCASVQRQGDRAFENDRCEQALENYDEAAEAGSKDPEMFHRAAQCAMKLGDLAAAERYYSQSMRFGAGLDVARELAHFYVSTSNYVSAIRVYQYLLYQDTQKQAVYNNLGTALMYAGQPFDAESYLMVAQQMDPVDPLPYVNLGMLYDRHLKQPWLAINFYECYDELTSGRAQNGRLVRQRAGELRERYYRLYEEEALACGKAYHPGNAVALIENLKELVEADLPVAEEPLPPDSEEPVGEGPVIERQVTEDIPTTAAPEVSSIERARLAYTKGRWAEAVDLFTSVPLSAMTPTDQKYLGIAYQKQANWAMASHWLELALTTGEDSEIVLALFNVYSRSKDSDRIAAMCKRYGKLPKYEKISAEHCPDSPPTN